MVIRIRSTISLVLLLTGLAGCAGLQSPHRDHLDAGDPVLRECAHWFRALDRAVARAGVSDIGARRIDGFPYLRVDRLAASFSAEARVRDDIHTAWIERLRELDRVGRRIEIANLPDTALRELDTEDRETLLARLADCAPRQQRLAIIGIELAQGCIRQVGDLDPATRLIQFAQPLDPGRVDVVTLTRLGAERSSQAVDTQVRKPIDSTRTDVADAGARLRAIERAKPVRTFAQQRVGGVEMVAMR